MEKPKRKQLYRKAVDKWGLDLQFIMLMEECSELIKAVSKYMRLSNKSAQPIRDLAEEIADVEIMIEQFKTVLSFEKLEKRVDTAKHDKLLRLKDMLELSPTSQTSPKGDFSNEKEHNISLKESANTDSQISDKSETSLNNNIHRLRPNFEIGSLVGRN